MGETVATLTKKVNALDKELKGAGKEFRKLIDENVDKAVGLAIVELRKGILEGLDQAVNKAVGEASETMAKDLAKKLGGKGTAGGADLEQLRADVDLILKKVPVSRG